MMSAKSVRDSRGSFTPKSSSAMVYPDSFSRRQAAVEEQGAADGFQGVRKDGLPAEAAGFQLAGAELQLIPQANGGGDFGQGLGAHDTGAETAQIAFGSVGESQVEVAGDREIQYRVAEEFEALVVTARSAAVGQRGDEQGGIAWLVFESRANPSKWPVAVSHLSCDLTRRHRI